MSLNRQIQSYIDEFRNVHGNGPHQITDIVQWMIAEGKWQPSIDEEMRLLTSHVREAMRSQYSTDPSGRRVRKNHSLRLEIVDNDGNAKQLYLWHTMEMAPPGFMQRSFQQRRDKIVDICWQFKQDVDSFNDYHNKGSFIQPEFNFTDDMAEKEIERLSAVIEHSA
ncbi:hypothetical protein GC207_15115 [bacterium]|nr:hypothetical protein [bacterium]